jgi:hypothetical protein
MHTIRVWRNLISKSRIWVEVVVITHAQDYMGPVMVGSFREEGDSVRASVHV